MSLFLHYRCSQEFSPATNHPALSTFMQESLYVDTTLRIALSTLRIEVVEFFRLMMTLFRALRIKKGKIKSCAGAIAVQQTGFCWGFSFCVVSSKYECFKKEMNLLRPFLDCCQTAGVHSEIRNKKFYRLHFRERGQKPRGLFISPQNKQLPAALINDAA